MTGGSLAKRNTDGKISFCYPRIKFFACKEESRAMQLGAVCSCMNGLPRMRTNQHEWRRLYGASSVDWGEFVNIRGEKDLAFSRQIDGI